MEIVWPSFAIAFCSRVSGSDEFPHTHRFFRIIQVFLVFFCRDKFPCTWPISSTRCSEYPRAFRCNEQSDYAQSKNLSRQRRPGLSSSASTLPRSCCVSVLFLHPFRHRPGAAGQAEILSAAERAEMADITKQIQKIVLLITCETPCCQFVCHLVFGVNVPDLNLRIQIDSVRQPIMGNCVFPTRVSLLDFCL